MTAARHSPDRIYDAFISYRRSDGGTVARWLRRELETFAPPRRLRDRRRAPLKVYLDTAYERGTIDFYEHTILPALRASRHLIIVATPDALKRREPADWMLREIEDFTGKAGYADVIVVRGAGAFGDPLPGGLRDRFPNVEIVDLRGASRFAAFNPFRAARLATEKLKVVAPLLQVPSSEMPALRLEEERRQQRRLGAAAGAAFAVVLMVTVAAAFATRNLHKAQTALDDSLFSIQRTIVAVGGGLPPEADPYGLRGTLLNESCDLKSKLEAEAARRSGLTEAVICEAERAHGYEAAGDVARAKAVLASLVHDATDERSRTNGASDALATIEAHVAHAALLVRLDDPQAPTARRALDDEIARATAAHGDDDGFVNGLAQVTIRRAEARRNAGHAALDAGDLPGAVRALNEAIALRRDIRFAAAGDADLPWWNTIAMAELAIAITAFERQQGHATAGAEALTESRRLMTTLRDARRPQQFDASVRDLEDRLRALR